MDSISFWFKLIGFIVIGIPIGLIVFFIIRTIKKSVVKPDEKTVKNQQSSMLTKLKQKQSNLTTWSSGQLVEISNNTDYNYSTGVYQKFNGYIFSSNNERLIAFRRIDHGLSIDSKIMAATSAQIFYFEANPTETILYINEKLQGYLKNNGILLDKNGTKLGQINRDQTPSSAYSLIMNGTKVALIAKNSDRRNLVKNQFHKAHSISGSEKALLWDKDPEFNNSMVKLLRGTTTNENDWILALIILELVTFGIDFTQK